jgi:hypothetical protein
MIVGLFCNRRADGIVQMKAGRWCGGGAEITGDEIGIEEGNGFIVSIKGPNIFALDFKFSSRGLDV